MPSDALGSLFSMAATADALTAAGAAPISLEDVHAAAVAREEAKQGRVDELATLSAHLTAATARWLELVWEMQERGDSSDLPSFLAWRCGLTGREVREYLRVAEALQELPAIRASFSSGAITFTKTRALTRVATPETEQNLLELAELLTAGQLERALRAFRRITVAEAREIHELEYVNYFVDHDGSVVLRARLAAEDGMVLIKALDAAQERIFERRRREQAEPEPEPADAPAAEAADTVAAPIDLPRPARVEALLELAGTALAATDEPQRELPRVVVHIDAAALTTDGRGRSELALGPLVAPETARRLGCDAEVVTQLERDGLPLSVGRKRRTVPPTLRRLVEARDSGTCCFPGCERQTHLEAHHREHWAHGGETTLDNLVLLCTRHHRFVHEGGYTIEDDPESGLRFRNRHGVVWPTAPPRPPPGKVAELVAGNDQQGLDLGPDTLRLSWGWDYDFRAVVDAMVRPAA